MTTDAAAPDWVGDAARMPVGFAQVREDSLLDLAVLEQIGKGGLNGIMITSGGCTAAALVASGRFAHLHLVDVNPAQIALCRLKLHLLQNASPLVRLQILGHFPMASGRAEAITSILESLSLPQDALGPLQTVATVGPDHAGRYELLFAQLRSEMSAFAQQWVDLLNLQDPADRATRINPDTTLGRAMDDAFERIMALPHLVRLFGASATQNRARSFAQHFASRTRHAVMTLPTAANPYLRQMLIGRFPERVAYPWLHARPSRQMPRITETVGTFDSALETIPDRFNFVHMSNILDWLSPDEARRTLKLARDATRPGGFVFIRQLNSTLDVAGLDDAFEWLTEEADALHARDRSFFYGRLHLGRKR